ncbi:hypothetical protein [Mesorhizobium delmotii]|uniref:Uncharacterized protein n=1 Tax=Mesorhizobium delmotii TaxID=1631247 RepID=A0A2P9APC6_9HYPH|nr:hypothetical protein [Mesorhizobium delmotii]SJM33014.1 hypothetical protein BQ8482_330149 [Mesorhizobium delmotii]
MRGAKREVGRPRQTLTAEEEAAREARRREQAKLRGRACRARRKQDKIADAIDGLVTNGDLPAWDDGDPAKVLAALLRRMRLDLN